MCCSLICYQDMYIMHKILLLHLKSVFSTLKSTEGLAALPELSMTIKTIKVH